jgi:hypothetical protein
MLQLSFTYSMSVSPKTTEALKCTRKFSTRVSPLAARRRSAITAAKIVSGAQRYMIEVRGGTNALISVQILKYP